MTRQFMVRILRTPDEEYVDMVVDAEHEDAAKTIALGLVNARPALYFGDPDDPLYIVDPSSEVEELDRSEYISANEVMP